VATSATPPPFALAPGTTYTLRGQVAGACTPVPGQTACTCSQSFTTNATASAFSSPPTPNCCGLGTGVPATGTLSLGAPAAWCKGGG
jgi:hypothetical protein